MKTMEIISFEKRTFEEIAAKLDHFVQRVESLCREHTQALDCISLNKTTAAGCASVREPCRP